MIEFRAKLAIVTTTPDQLTQERIEKDQLILVDQVHSNIVHRVTHKTPSGVMPAGDGLRARDRALAIRTADCLPVYIEGPEGYALIHAGWRGLHLGILEDLLIQELEPELAWIGPSICQDCYQVGEEFTANFPNSDSFKRVQGKLYLSLQNEAKRVLTRLFPRITVEYCEQCTFCLPHWHSHRRDQTTLRNWTIATPLSPDEKEGRS
jgi:polyphenol oxidase